MANFFKPFQLSNFRRLFVGVTTSHFGDQFALIATPWLVIRLGGDPLDLGLVLAIGGGPRALLMLLGGAVTDRYSPRLVLLACDMLRVFLTGLMAFLVLFGNIEIWMVYLFALGFGLISGFAIPSGNSMVPHILEQKDYEAGNASVMGGGQIMGFVGPFAAGALIGAHSEAIAGVGICFFIDALTFAISIIMLLSMSEVRILAPSDRSTGKETLWHSVLESLRYVWEHQEIKLCFLIIAAVNFLFVGPFMVGLPILAETRFPEGPVAFGLLMSGFAGGNLIGFLIAGSLAKPSATTFQTVLIVVLACFALSLGALGFVTSVWLNFVMLMMLGVGNGYVTIVLISELQAQVPKAMLGRLMGLFMFAGLGIVPISQAISGAIANWDVSTLFFVVAVTMAHLAIWFSMMPNFKVISLGMMRHGPNRS